MRETGERMDTISIVVPIYNVRPYLEECLGSILRQSYANWEAILVDDGSFDGSEKICEEYAQKDGRFKVFHQKNTGAANAKNLGLDHASGEFITFLDSDDFVESTWLESMIHAAHESQADIVECLFCREYLDEAVPAVYERGGSGEFTAQAYLAEYLFDWSSSLFWNKLFARKTLEAVRFRRERRCIDDEFFTYKAISGARKVIRLELPLYHYRQRASSAVASKKNQEQITDDALEVLKERYHWISRRFPELRMIYLRHDVDIMFYFAREFVFTDSTITKFHDIRRYYLKECLMHYPGRVTLINAVQLMTFTRGRLKANVGKQAEKATKRFYP